jgi:hypothetical protein
MIGIGVARPEAPDEVDYQFEFCDPIDLLWEPARFVDDERISRDVERFTGIRSDVANSVLNAEFEYLRLRGLA